MAEKYAKQQSAVSARYAISSDWKTCRRMCVSINGPDDLLTLKLVCVKGGEPSVRIWVHWAFGFSSYSVCTRRTDGRTDGQKQSLLPLPYTGGGIISDSNDNGG